MTARILAALILLTTAQAACAEDYPTRPVTIVVPFAAGGGTDLLARMLGQKLEQRLGKPFVIEDKPGGGTVVGASAVAKAAAADGYTLLMATSTPMAINVTVHKSLPYDPAADLIPLALVAQVPFVLVVNPDLPVRTVGDLIAYAKANPGALSFGSSGPGSPHHLYMELFRSMTGVAMTHIPYKGSVPALNDVIAGHIPLMFCDFAPAAAQIQGGKVRALAVSTKTRVADFPDIPTVDEAGVPGFEAAAWQMLVAPANTPAPIVQKLHDTLLAILALPETKQQIAKVGMLPMDNKPIAGLQGFVKSEIVRWGKVVQQAGIAGSE
jgi:tripartite-type tricarboxylate transporter receptor subunit TctC